MNRRLGGFSFLLQGSKDQWRNYVVYFLLVSFGTLLLFSLSLFLHFGESFYYPPPMDTTYTWLTRRWYRTFAVILIFSIFCTLGRCLACLSGRRNEDRLKRRIKSSKEKTFPYILFYWKWYFYFVELTQLANLCKSLENDLIYLIYTKFSSETDNSLAISFKYSYIVKLQAIISNPMLCTSEFKLSGR